jgi:hypothetical protein
MATPHYFHARLLRNQKASRELADTGDWLRRKSERLLEESQRLIQQSQEIRKTLPGAGWQTQGPPAPKFASMQSGNMKKSGNGFTFRPFRSVESKNEF